MYPYDNYGYGTMPANFNYNVPNYNAPKPANTNKIYVSSIEEVKSKPLPAGSDYIFLDNDKPILYQKIVSPNGQFEVKTFSISPYSPTEGEKTNSTIDLSNYVKTSDLEPIMAEIKELKTKLAPKKVEVSNGTTGTKQI